MGGSGGLPDEVGVKRSDPVYAAHAYLTKVPYSAIVPFIEAMTRPGDTVLDPFAGSGMTGVAAAMTGRRAELRDISALGRHIGTNYVSLVAADSLQEAARIAVEGVRERLGDVYAVGCAACGERGSLSKTVWTIEYECRSCGRPVRYYEAFRAAGWRKKAVVCPACGVPCSTRQAARLAEAPVADHVRCGCSRTIRDQPHSTPLVPVDLSGLSYPDVEIGAHRQMFQASALGKHGLVSTASFFSTRNLAVLAALHENIQSISPEPLRDKLMFAFTAILTRASKRYQWHPKRPVNAANQNYYIAPVFYEWNVYELFERKVAAAIRSDAFIRQETAARGVVDAPAVNYELGSADAIDLPDGSIDYVFTDPPFGSNIFYSDMNLFQEAWLGELTDDAKEAVVDRANLGGEVRSAERYRRLIVGALEECRRVLRPEGRVSMVFSNSKGELWSLVQEAIAEAGLTLDHVAILDKGQRSLKGLASGFEGVVTSDLILTMRPGRAIQAVPSEPPLGALEEAIDEALHGAERPSPTRIYLDVVTRYLKRGWRVEGIGVADIRDAVLSRGHRLDPASGLLHAEPASEDAVATAA